MEVAEIQLVAMSAGVGRNARLRLIVVIDGCRPGGSHRVRGIGETTVRGVRAERARRVLRNLEASLQEHIHGLVLSGSSPIDLARAVADARTRLPDRAQRIAGMPVELALLDAASRSVQQPLHELLGGRRRRPRLTVASVDVRGSDPTTAATAITAAGPAPDATRMRFRLRTPGDLALLRELIESPPEAIAPRIAGGLWLDLRRPIGADQSADVVRELIEALRAASSPPRLLVQGLLPEDDIVGLERLQEAATPHLARMHEGGGDLQLVATATPANVEELLERRLTAVALTPHRAGGPLNAIRMADRIAGLRAGIGLLVHPAWHGGVVDEWITYHLASSCRQLDHLAGAAAATPRSSSALLRAAPELEGDGATYRPPSEHGLGASTDLAPALERFLGYRSISDVATPSADDEPSPRRYRTSSMRNLAKHAVDNHLLELECLGRGLTITRTATQRFIAADDATGSSIAFDRAAGDLSCAAGYHLTKNKGATRRVLELHGVPVPLGRAFEASERHLAVNYAESIGYPVVAKPAGGSLGTAVTTDIRDRVMLEEALERIAASRYAPSGVVVERFVNGRDYRAFVLAGQVVSLVERVPGFVAGDGRHTVVELMLRKNESRRATNPYLGRRLLSLGSIERAAIARQGLEPSSVPQPGQHVRLSSAANLSQGGESYEVRDEAHPQLLEEIGRVGASIPGILHCGVDLILEDHRDPDSLRTMAVIEANYHAELALHRYPMQGRPSNVARHIVLHHLRHAGIPTRPRTHASTVNLRVHGKVQGVGYRRWFADLATARGLRGWIANGGRGEIVAAVTGPIEGVASLASLAITGPPRSRPIEVRTTTADEQVGPGFRILTHRPS